MKSSFVQFLENRYLCGTVALFLSIFGVIGNIVIILSKSIPKKRLMGSLIIASFLFLISCFIVYIPCAFTYCPYYDAISLNLLSTPDTIGYLVYQMTLVQLLMDRFLYFFAPRLYKYAQKMETYISACIWIFVTTLTILESFFHCLKAMDIKDLRFYFAAEGRGEILLTIHIWIAYGAPITLVVLSIAIFSKLHLLRNAFGASRTAEEFYLMLQYAFICAFSCLGCVCFFFLPQLRILLDAKLTLLPPITSIISITSHSYIILLTNRKSTAVMEDVVDDSSVAVRSWRHLQTLHGPLCQGSSETSPEHVGATSSSTLYDRL